MRTYEAYLLQHVSQMLQHFATNRHGENASRVRIVDEDRRASRRIIEA